MFIALKAPEHVGVGARACWIFPVFLLKGIFRSFFLHGDRHFHQMSHILFMYLYDSYIFIAEYVIKYLFIFPPNIHAISAFSGSAFMVKPFCHQGRNMEHQLWFSAWTMALPSLLLTLLLRIHVFVFFTWLTSSQIKLRRIIISSRKVSLPISPHPPPPSPRFSSFYDLLAFVACLIIKPHTLLWLIGAYCLRTSIEEFLLCVGPIPRSGAHLLLELLFDKGLFCKLKHLTQCSSNLGQDPGNDLFCYAHWRVVLESWSLLNFKMCVPACQEWNTYRCW